MYLVVLGRDQDYPTTRNTIIISFNPNVRGTENLELSEDLEKDVGRLTSVLKKYILNPLIFYRIKKIVVKVSTPYELLVNIISLSLFVKYIDDYSKVIFNISGREVSGDFLNLILRLSCLTSEEIKLLKVISEVSELKTSTTTLFHLLKFVHTRFSRLVKFKLIERSGFNRCSYRLRNKFCKFVI